MAYKKPLVLGSNGYIEELQSGDYIADPTPDIITGTAGEDLAVGDAVYVKAADGKFWKASAAAIGTMPAVAFAAEAILADAAGKLQVDGVVSGFTGLTPGGPVFVSETAGEVTQTPPTGAGKVVQIVGHAISATELEINFKMPIRRG